MTSPKFAYFPLLLLLCRAAFPSDPDLSNIHYGPHERNVLDVWKAKSDRPTPLVIFMHGGSFITGDKSTIDAPLADSCLNAGISVASLNYRYSTQAPYPAQFQDATRAVQFCRLHAAEWNLDPKKFAGSGSSAGAVLALWIGFHDDMADPASADPLARMSTRFTAMGVIAAQVTVDPRVFGKELSPDLEHNPGFARIYGLPEAEMQSERAHKLFEEASPINYLSSGDPPVFMFYSIPNKPLPGGSPSGRYMHHPRNGYMLKERMDQLGLECQVHLLSEYHGDQAAMYRQMVQFFQKHFGR
jgi:acetyl esterase